jgi:hypothetical protein
MRVPPSPPLPLMPRSSRPALLCLLAFAIGTSAQPVKPAPPTAPPAPETLQRWRSGNGWLTELRRHPDGTTSCATGKSFADHGNFGLFMLRTATVTLFSVVDQQQPFTGPGTLKLMQGMRVIGTFDAQAQGPALATVELESRQVKAAIDRVEAGPLDIEAAGRHFNADMAGVDRARAQLDACVALSKPGR